MKGYTRKVGLRKPVWARGGVIRGGGRIPFTADDGFVLAPEFVRQIQRVDWTLAQIRRESDDSALEALADRMEAKRRAECDGGQVHK